MNEVQKILNVVWAYVPEREVVVMSFLDTASGGAISIEELKADNDFESWDELVGRVLYSAKESCERRNAILEKCEYFKNLEKQFDLEQEPKEKKS